MDQAALERVIAANPTLDDGEIVDLCVEDLRTIHPVRLDKLRPLLAKYELGGSLQLVALDPSTTVPVKVSILNALNYVTSPQEVIDSDGEFAGLFDQTISGLLGLGLISHEVFDEMLALGGGYLLRDTTLQDVANARAHIAGAARSRLFQDYRDKVQAAVAHHFNEQVNPSETDPNSPVPTFPDDFVLYIDGLE